jgi:transcriptional regulator with XRE-family HTH domain
MESFVDTAKLRALIKRKYGTQENFAEAVGMTRQYIGLILHGERSPKLATLYRFADALGVKVETLLRQRSASTLQSAPMKEMAGD